MALILTRRIGERIMIGDDVTLEILSIRGNQVRIGIDAPKEVAVNREEIHIRKNNNQDDNRGNK